MRTPHPHGPSPGRWLQGARGDHAGAVQLGLLSACEHCACIAPLLFIALWMDRRKGGFGNESVLCARAVGYICSVVGFVVSWGRWR